MKGNGQNIPIVSNVNFGHVYPFITLPIGGKARIHAKGGKVSIKLFSSNQMNP
ncbi:hypothetical protein [Peribacillus tepidiphilus]|uniref:hypothetical protein n=1 Tax=Peribacillus tepidiphilus TaxID=2652445 RepID=UPI0035B50F96